MLELPIGLGDTVQLVQRLGQPVAGRQRIVVLQVLADPLLQLLDGLPVLALLELRAPTLHERRRAAENIAPKSTAA